MTVELAPVAALERLIHRREALRVPFQTACRHVAARSDEAALDIWSRAVLDLLHTNAGAGCVLAFLKLSAQTAPDRIASLPAIGKAAAAICRHAGGSAAQTCVEAVIRLGDKSGAWTQGSGWWDGLTRLAQQAPDCVAPFAERAETVLRATGASGLTAFIGTGLKLAGRDKARRHAFFSLEDPAARRELDRLSGLVSLTTLDRGLKLFGRTLWGRTLLLRPAPILAGRPAPRRTSISNGVILLPDSFAGVPPAQARTLFRAAVTHAGAHLEFTPERSVVGTLKPLQFALIGLVEDARVEALAMRRYPGLRRLWQPFHIAAPEGNTAPALMARLARALIDADYEDPHGFVAKGRALFAAGALEDAALSRRIGGLLGNDLGQMRAQFDPRTYVVEPAYRDDGLGLWDHGDPPEPPSEVIELQIQAARPRPDEGARPTPDQSGDRSDGTTGAPRAKPVGIAEGGFVLARYPEWDQAAGVERPDWTCVREVPAALGDPARLEAALSELPDLRRRLDRMVRAARPGRPVRLRRQPEGPDLDLDAVIDAATAHASGREQDERIYRLTALRTRDLATAVLLDVSESTRDRVGNGTVLEIERIAVALLADALARLGDPFTLLAFASDGREAVRLTRIKDFSEPYGITARARLMGLQSGLSTRLGAAIRHAGAELGRVSSFRRLVLVLSDGEPSDIDVQDSRELVEDARRAGLTLRARGIDVFGVTMGEGADAAAVSARIFGSGGFALMRRLGELPARLSDLYFRLSRR
jgi:uncharacterized protein YegL